MRSFAITLALALATALFATYANSIIINAEYPFAGLGLVTTGTLVLLGALSLTTLGSLLLKRDMRVWVAGSQMLLAIFFGTLFVPENGVVAVWLLGYGGLLALGISWATRKPKA